ncbi:hypothetical protein HOA55_00145 [archaeon]|jgi:hypothetical protein|nr:hypothetical protein [archaeon]MBT3577886.1 hypothetical protein [archaeon]MBT6819750.1 hypothetical protein [archaeon]MBT6955958.1 hypothetical protein [archaeon]MBT7025533.1 hypothetical protein [archaeon]
MISKDWFIGFIEGEGNFNISLSKALMKKSKSYLFEFYPILQFRIFLREDDKEALEKIKNFVGVGKIYKKSYKYSRKKGVNSQDQYVYMITSIKNLLVLKELLISSNFHTKKKKDMEIFFKVLDLKIEKKHLTLDGYNEIMALVANLNSLNRENFRVKPVTE